MDGSDTALMRAWRRAAGKTLLLDMLLALVLAFAVLRDAVDARATIGDVLVAGVAFVAVLIRRLPPTPRSPSPPSPPSARSCKASATPG